MKKLIKKISKFFCRKNKLCIDVYELSGGKVTEITPSMKQHIIEAIEEEIKNDNIMAKIVAEGKDYYDYYDDEDYYDEELEKFIEEEERIREYNEYLRELEISEREEIEEIKKEINESLMEDDDISAEDDPILAYFKMFYY